MYGCALKFLKKIQKEQYVVYQWTSHLMNFWKKFIHVFFYKNRPYKNVRIQKLRTILRTFQKLKLQIF